MDAKDGGRAPWHLWAVGTAALLWNAAGAVTIWMAQAGGLAVSPGETAYYAAQPFWFIALTDIALIAAIGGAILLLMRSRKAVRLFGLSLAAILVTHVYDLVMGTSRSFANSGALAVNIVIFVLAVLAAAYAWWMKKRGVLR